MSNTDDILDLDSQDAEKADQHHKHIKYALKFAGTYGGTLLHVRGLGWHRWRGTHWEVCEDGAECRAVRKMLHAAQKSILKITDTDRKKRLLNEAVAIETAGGVKSVLELAQTEHPIGATVSDMNQGAELLNTPSGILNLDTGEVTPCAPEARMSKVTGVAFDPEAQSDVWDAFLEQIQPDPDVRAFLARSLGSAMLGKVRDQVLHIWHGAGANGKGTLRDAVMHALGAYAQEVPTSILLVNKYGEDATLNDRVKLLGTRLAFCSEVGKTAKLDEAVTKKLTGDDEVSAKLLFKDKFSFKPTHQLFMLTNFLPEVSGDDPAVWRRMIAIPFSTNIPESEWDLDLKQKLCDAGPAVLAWLYKGWLEYQEKGLAAPEVVRKYTDSYKADSDSLGQFLAEKTITGPGFFVASKDLFEEWSAYCAGEGVVAGTKTAFGKSMRNRGFASEKKGGGRMVYTGLALVSEDEGPGDSGWGSTRRSAG